jgi:hypothetical protein
VQSSEHVHRTIRKTLNEAAGTAVHHACNKNYFSTQLEALPDLKICNKAVLKITQQGTPAKGYNSRYKAYQHKLSTVPHAQTLLFCVYVRGPGFFLQPTDKRQNHSRHTNCMCRHGIMHQSPQLEYTPQFSRNGGLCAPAPTMHF